MSLGKIKDAIAKVDQYSKQYEFITMKHDPFFEDLVSTIEIVKDYIHKHKLIIYGGSAIDYALRLRGDKIYPDDLLKVPDLDFYSPQSVEDAYELADKFYIEGYKESRAIKALHAETMRVDIGNKHFIADITYRPSELFKEIPKLKYDNLFVVHPMFQRIDIHHSLSFPFDNPPREVIFSRWSKDIKRFGLLDKHYPIKTTMSDVKKTKVSLPIWYKKFVFTGFLAYAFIYKQYIKDMELMGENPQDVIKLDVEINNDEIIFDTLDSRVDIIHYDIDKASEKICKKSSLSKTKYETYLQIVPERIELITESYKIIIQSSENKLLSINSVEDNYKFRISNSQYVMKHFMAMYYYYKHKPLIAESYLCLYDSLLKMVKHFNKVANKCAYGSKQLDHLLGLSINTYGNKNISLSKKILLNQINNKIKNEPLYKTPRSYYPDRIIPKELPKPEFDEISCELFKMSGKKIH